METKCTLLWHICKFVRNFVPFAFFWLLFVLLSQTNVSVKASTIVGYDEEIDEAKKSLDAAENLTL